MAVDAVQSEILRAKLDAVTIHQRSTAKLEAFKDIALDGCPDVRSVINSGARDFNDLRALIHKAKTFRRWIADKSPDAELAKNYILEVKKESWADKLPSKVVRFGILTGICAAVEALTHGSGVGTAITTGIGAADLVLLDKVLKGWRPNQFVDGDLKKFVSGSSAPFNQMHRSI
jgi:hypothetical protein